MKYIGSQIVRELEKVGIKGKRMNIRTKCMEKISSLIKKIENAQKLTDKSKLTFKNTT
jgi:hypothetical protein